MPVVAVVSISGPIDHARSSQEFLALWVLATILAGALGATFARRYPTWDISRMIRSGLALLFIAMLTVAIVPLLMNVRQVNREVVWSYNDGGPYYLLSWGYACFTVAWIICILPRVPASSQGT